MPQTNRLGDDDLKGYYIYFGTGSSGVKKKIEMQIRELAKVSEIELLRVEEKKNRKIIDRFFAKFPCNPNGFDYSSLKKRIICPDYLYIRRTTADTDLISFLKYIKCKYPYCKILIEFYTFPYDKDDFNRNLIHSIINLPYFIKDHFYRREYSRCIDRIVTYSYDKVIFGVKTINTTNGIDVDSIVPVRKEFKNNNIINLVSVAQLQPHHGYERLLAGLKDYYFNKGKRKIIYHCIGDGEELSKYKRIVKRYGLEDNVIFYGKQFGDDLNHLYDIADIAISSLGLYKYGIQTISTLKTCEYLAKGLPVISGCNTSMLHNSETEFIYQFNNNNEPIDINRILAFYDSLVEKYGISLSEKIRSFASSNFNMPYVMKPIIDYIEEHD